MADDKGKKAKGGNDLYDPAVRWLHWLNGAGMVTCVLLVLRAQNTAKQIEAAISAKKLDAVKALKAQKDLIMHYHESFGLLMLIVVIPRIIARFSKEQNLDDIVFSVPSGFVFIIHGFMI